MVEGKILFYRGQTAMAKKRNFGFASVAGKKMSRKYWKRASELFLPIEISVLEQILQTPIIVMLPRVVCVLNFR